jgi:hypothetical protein
MIVEQYAILSLSGLVLMLISSFFSTHRVGGLVGVGEMMLSFVPGVG